MFREVRIQRRSEEIESRVNECHKQAVRVTEMREGGKEQKQFVVKVNDQ